MIIEHVVGRERRSHARGIARLDAARQFEDRRRHRQGVAGTDTALAHLGARGAAIVDVEEDRGTDVGVGIDLEHLKGLDLIGRFIAPLPAHALERQPVAGDGEQRARHARVGRDQ